MQKILISIALFILTACSMTTPAFQPSTMQTYALRLHPGQDLKLELQKFTEAHAIKAACILTCVGSLQQSTLRLANQSEYKVYPQKMEIVSLVGILSTEGSHLHVSLADSTGVTIGGHLVEGSQIYTTAEIIIGIMPDYRFAREHDTVSGYKELKIYPSAKE
ncbi:DNA-binding protein [Rhodocytophaga aerolata]|uniref:DNA-binding protein n=1 Tax=Rhodocytophaga aerolata TaxID=455078 RepID=A0ABT8R9U4_9BACT|nr:PPC domain-containing DNA-binding protein [Rhodocytophaga aerolata]MDO1447537.1 DNA-binding protein [Rhodocytophaga aerolata]